MRNLTLITLSVGAIAALYLTVVPDEKGQPQENTTTHNLLPKQEGKQLLDGKNHLSQTDGIETNLNQKQNNSHSKKIENYKDPNPNLNSVEERLEKVSQWTDPSEFSGEEILAAIENEVLWDLSELVSPDPLPLDETEKEDGRAFFHAEQVKVAVSIPGDAMTIVVPDTGETLELTVSEVGSRSSGLVTVHGSINDDPSSSFNMTRGDNFIAGHINSSTNTYSFEIFGNTGWIHSSGALFTEELPPVAIHEEEEGHSSEHHHHTPTDDGIIVVTQRHSPHRGEQQQSTTSTIEE